MSCNITDELVLDSTKGDFIRILTLLAVALLAPVAAAGEPEPAVTDCYDTAYTQRDMNMCSSSGASEAQTELEIVFQKVLERHKNAPEFVQRMRLSQEAWKKYVDALLAARYPPVDGNSRPYGSIFPMCWNTEFEAVTRERVAALRRWLVGTPEGDSCAGSYPWRHQSEE